MKKTIMERLGLEPVRKLNKTICLERTKYLRNKLEKNGYRGELVDYAKYYANWYSWMAKQGGSRSQPRRAA
jgi:hypothetical protein